MASAAFLKNKLRDPSVYLEAALSNVLPGRVQARIEQDMLKRKVNFSFYWSRQNKPACVYSEAHTTSEVTDLTPMGVARKALGYFKARELLNPSV